MNSNYIDLFDDLVKSYYDGNFDETLMRIIGGHDKSPQETYKIITSLCGVDIPYDNNYISNLKNAITQYSVNKHIIEKLDDCSISCSPDSSNNFNCQNACPLNAIVYNEATKSPSINYDLCCECGLCIDSCKDGKILDKVDFIPIKEIINQNESVIAIVSPSIVGQFGDNVSIDQLRATFIKLGFKDMVEVSFAGDALALRDAINFNEIVKTEKDFMITSGCCPIWFNMLKEVKQDISSNIIPSVSPMIATGKIIKELNTEAKVVFISPCIAKKAECKEEGVAGIIDFVLTYQELDSILKIVELNPSELKGIPSLEYASKCGRLYSISSGVSIAISEIVNELYPDRDLPINFIAANGIESCKDIINKMLIGDLNYNLIEGMACTGGCVGGPKTLLPINEATDICYDFAKKSPIQVPMYNESLNNFLSLLEFYSFDDLCSESDDNLFNRNL